MSKSADPKPIYLQQSPIDLGSSVYAPMDNGQMAFGYPAPLVSGVVDGEGAHAKVNVVDDVRIPLFGMQLKLKQLHFHSPGEHALHGVKWPLELHLVHEIVSGQTGMHAKSTLLVLGVFYYGATEGPGLPILPKFGQQIQTARSKKQDGSAHEELKFNPNHCLPPQAQRSRFFRYQGSPPFTKRSIAASTGSTPPPSTDWDIPRKSWPRHSPDCLPSAALMSSPSVGGSGMATGRSANA